MISAMEKKIKQGKTDRSGGGVYNFKRSDQQCRPY